MLSSGLEVNTSALDADTASIRREIMALRQDAQSLRAMAAVLSMTWEGETKDTFLRQLERSLARLDEAVEALRSFDEQTEQSCAEYERCEQAVAAVVASLRI